jgi:hypothetical protein
MATYIPPSNWSRENEVIGTVVRVDGNSEAVKEAIRTANLPRYGSLERILTAYETAYHHLTSNYSGIGALKKILGICCERGRVHPDFD